MSLAGNSWCPKPDNIPFLGSKRRFLCLFRDCCGFDLWLAMLQVGGDQWATWFGSQCCASWCCVVEKRCSICCASCAQSFWTVMQHSGFNWSSWNMDLSYFKEGFSLKKDETLDNFGYPDPEQQHHFHNCCAFDAIFGSKKRRTKKPTQTPGRLKISGRLCVVNLHCWRVGFLGVTPEVRSSQT